MHRIIINIRQSASITEQLSNLTPEATGKFSHFICKPQSNETFEKHADEIFRAASLIKLPILWAYLIEVSRKAINPKSWVELTENVVVPGTGALKNRAIGSIVSFEEMALLMIIESDNTATNILIDLLGMPLINQAIVDLGMATTQLQRKMQDFNRVAQGFENTTSARDIGFFLLKIVEGLKQNDPIALAMHAHLATQRLNEKLPFEIPASVACAHKTGDLPHLEHDAGILSYREEYCVVVALSDQLSINSVGVNYCRQVGRISAQLLMA